MFLDAGINTFEDPATLPDVDAALDRLASARSWGERVVVYGDFDADGVTGTALLTKALRRYGLDVSSYIPHRVSEGHGLNVPAVEQLARQGAQLIVTVDCGITDVEAVARAGSLGVDTIITDHHVAPPALPQASAVVNPHAPHSRYAFDHLTGVGMSLKLAHALLEPEAGGSWADGLMELAAIGTVTDMAPLLGENRAIVREGLRHLGGTSSVGLRALLLAGRTDPTHASAETIGFTIGPRLNAAGRLGHAEPALELLLTADAERAKALVAELDGYNTERQQLTEKTLQRARALVPSTPPPLIMVGEPDFNPGVVGLVAGKLSEEFGAPAVVYAEESGRILASCRTAPGFHWANALSDCSDLLLRHGGHAGAAGFSCDPASLDALRERLEAIAAEQLGEGSRASDGVVDAEVELRELMGPSFQLLRRMEPFGVGNPAPLFLSRGVGVERATPMGSTGNHFRMTLRSSGATWDAVAFRQSWVNGTTAIDVVYTLDVDHWNGQPRLRLTIKDYAPSAQPRLAL